MKKSMNGTYFLDLWEIYVHVFKIMRMTLILLLFGFSSVFADSSYSQNAQLSIHLKNGTMKQLFEEIQKQSEFIFFYKDSQVDLNKSINIDLEKASVQQILKQALANTDLGYEVFDRQIVILPGKKQADPKEKSESSLLEQPQKKSISGHVTDSSGGPLPGVSVVVKGTTTGTITDSEGDFSLQVPDDAKIVSFSFVGMKTQEVLIGEKSEFNVVLEEETVGIDEVVAVGYGTQKKANLTGAVTQVKMDDVMGDRPIISATAALQGSMPGVVVSGGAQPGTSKVIKIRGTYSINESNNESALILIDNVPGDMDMINPDDIESVSVLKDAASAAIYGARAASGVILVTTKHPTKESNFKFNYSYNQGFETSVRMPKQVSLTDYLNSYKDFGYTTHYSDTQDLNTWIDLVDKYQKDPNQLGTVGDGILKYTDGRVYYLHEKNPYDTYMETGRLANHNFSASGATKNLRYRLSLGYNREDGPLILSKDVYERKSINTFLSADIKPWYTQELNIMYTNGVTKAPQDETGNGFFNFTQYQSYVPEGYCPAEITGTDHDVLFLTPKNQIVNSNIATTTTVTPRIFLKSIFKPLDDLTLTFEYTFNKKEVNYKYYSGLFEYTTDQLGVKKVPTSGDTYTKWNNFKNYNAYNAYANYSKTFGGHAIQAMGGFNQEESYYDYTYSQIKDQVVTSVPSFKGGSGISTQIDNYEEYTIRGGFGRINYSYNNKYLLELNGRYDGSSKFPKKNRYGFFPSGSIGWKIDKENFMNFAEGWMDELKLRASYGEIGNQNVNAYGYSPTMTVSTTTTWLKEGAEVIYFQMPSMVRDNFTWETVKTLDFGLDIALWKNRMNATFDWYQRNTDGMLASNGVDLPAVIGADAPMQNVANMKTRGWEFNISYKNKIGNDFNYRASFNIFDATTKITKFANESGLLSNHYKGETFNEIWGYVSDGYYTIDDFDIDAVKSGTWILKNNVTSIEGMSNKLRPGDLKYRDLTNDGIVTKTGDNTVTNPGDRKVIGNSTPRYNFGATFGGSYKGFDLSIMLQGVMKRDYPLGSNIIFPFRNANQFSPLFQGLTDYWKPLSTDASSADFYVAENDNAKYPRIYDNANGNAGSNGWTNTKYLSNGAYMRIKNVTLSYTLPENWLKLTEISKAKLFISVENLATFTSLQKGIDPENMSWGYPFYRTISIGANVTF